MLGVTRKAQKHNFWLLWRDVFACRKEMYENEILISPRENHKNTTLAEFLERFFWEKYSSLYYERTLQNSEWLLGEENVIYYLLVMKLLRKKSTKTKLGFFKMSKNAQQDWFLHKKSNKTILDFLRYVEERTTKSLFLYEKRMKKTIWETENVQKYRFF